MDNTLEMQTAARYEMRIRHYASDLADMVEAGDITDTQANERLAALQDRLVRDGAWA